MWNILGRLLRANALKARVETAWQSVSRDFFDPYQPELHYMRGPGPKWLAKYDPALLTVGTPARALARARRRADG
jgi:hypothetical protein